MSLSYLRRLLNKNSIVYTLLIGLCLAAYINILGNEFTVVDDIPTFVNNDVIKSFSASIKTFQLQLIFYSVFYHLFGMTPVPVHILSIFLHIINVILLFTILRMIFDREIAVIATILFAVHPINTEAVTWISGEPYLFNALTFNLTILTYLLYRKTKSNQYLITSISIFITSMILIQTIWLVTIPIIIFILEQSILEKKFNPYISKKLLLYVIPIVVFGTIYIGIRGTARLATRAIEKPLNQQALTPIIEGAPYTIFTMAKLYLYPKDLMIYYDGNPITQQYYVTMYIFTVLYLAAVIYFWKKNRHVSGILLILALLLAPTYSPIKVSWYLSERYLYYGTGFFCTLLVLLFIKIKKQYHLPVFPLIAVILLTGIYTYRTIIRNRDYKTSTALALKTIELSPSSIRGYDDLGGVYLMAGNFQSASKLFHKTLTILPEANTAVSNLGYIYILYGLPDKPDFIVKPDKKMAEQQYQLGTKYAEQERYTNAFFYLYRSSLYDPTFVNPQVSMADIYIKMQQYKFAEKLLNELLTKFPQAYQINNKLAFIAFQQKKYDKAEKYLQEVLKHEPNSKNALDNLNLVKQAQQNSR